MPAAHGGLWWRTSARECQLVDLQHYESAIDEEQNEEEPRMKDACSQVPSPPGCLSRAMQAVQDACDAEAQTQGWDPALFIELTSTPRNRDVVTAELKGELEALQERHASEVQELRDKMDKLLQTLPPEPTRSEVKVKNHTAKKEKPTSKNWEGALIRPRTPQPRPRPKQRKTYPQPIPRPDEKPRWLPVSPRPRPLPPPDKKLRRFATLLPVPEFTELPNVKSMRSSQEESLSKSKMEQQISKIVRMVEKKQPDYTDEEFRRLFDHLRQKRKAVSHG
ncbi:hypothetical protein HPB49_022094 [Dermacentor silvarum]|uniref:Uncharacterized protein n=1 Tax=Dermacentor silvarum TaxID=543639 RepID=A0ACB8E3A1_DERSI|nr:hypothetical protein HPB49_022094 [Dermacentor silvarum]